MSNSNLNHTFQIERYTKNDRETWDEFLSSIENYTFQHERAFLDRTNAADQETSLIARNTKGIIVGLFPSCYIKKDNVIVSHYGSSYGGARFAKNLDVNDRLLVYRAFIHNLESAYGGSTLKVRIPPLHLNSNEGEFESWILHRLGFLPDSLYIHSAINLRDRVAFKKGKVRASFSDDLEVFETESDSVISELWTIVSELLRDRHGVNPVHEVEEVIRLKKLFPNFIRIFVCTRFSQVIGGLIFFNTIHAFHLQYMAIGNMGRTLAAGDFLIKRTIEIARLEEYKYFNFGHSHDLSKIGINIGLWEFKSKFGSKDFSSVTWARQL